MISKSNKNPLTRRGPVVLQNAPEPSNASSPDPLNAGHGGYPAFEGSEHISILFGEGPNPALAIL